METLTIDIEAIAKIREHLAFGDETDEELQEKIDDGELVQDIDGNWHYVDDCVVVNDERYYCDDRRVVQDHDGDYILRDEATRCNDVDGYVHDEYIHTCHNCGDTFYYEDSALDCCPDEDESNSDIHSHDYKPTTNFLYTESEYIPSTQFIGIEMEFHGLEHTDFASDVHSDWQEVFYCKEDGSLDDGVEVVSHPFSKARYKENKNAFANITEKANIYNGFTNGDSGIHIHMGRGQLTDAQFEVIEDFIIDGDNSDYIQRIAGRPENKRCQKKKGIGSSDRYCAVNWCNERTVEIRIFRSSKNPKHILGRIEFVFALLSLARSKKRITKDDIELICLGNTDYSNLEWLLNEKSLVDNQQ